ncbi:hypothetical protein L21SP2_2927 [Salinispira pacifica]|uniref:Uncharacterized protein n=1 Tax=Salinispira pacifica TaxID=1307761 RepID=V5WKJ5_9SPIO|nr:hypothetical protein L21SP2_2927 [Salinispira pacifica]
MQITGRKKPGYIRFVLFSLTPYMKKDNQLKLKAISKIFDF